MDSPAVLLADALKAATAELAAAGVPTPRVDAELLAAHLLGVSRGRLSALALLDTPTPDGYADLVGQRAQRIPLQHLTGLAPFYGLELAVGPGVFTPRFETEILVEHAVAEARSVMETQGHCRVVDLATGSGAIALAIKTTVLGAEVFAVELSDLALAWAQKNLAETGVELVHGDLRTALPDLAGQVDVLVSNPPYIPADQVPVDQEVHEHDPQMALYGGGADGLELPLAVAARGVDLLTGGGLLLMEHADTQGAALRNAFARDPRLAGNYDPAHTYPDLAGKDRITVARKVTQ